MRPLCRNRFMPLVFFLSGCVLCYGMWGAWVYYRIMTDPVYGLVHPFPHPDGVMESIGQAVYEFEVWRTGLTRHSVNFALFVILVFWGSMIAASGMVYVVSGAALLTGWRNTGGVKLTRLRPLCRNRFVPLVFVLSNWIFFYALYGAWLYKMSMTNPVSGLLGPNLYHNQLMDAFFKVGFRIEMWWKGGSSVTGVLGMHVVAVFWGSMLLVSGMASAVSGYALWRGRSLP